jgi:hypothetical protein
MPNKFKTRLKESIVHLFGGTVIQDYGASLNGVGNESLQDNFLFDFKQGYRTSWIGGGTIAVNGQSSSGEPFTPPAKIIIKPIDVINELQTVPTPFDVNYLDEKISVLEAKSELIRQQYAKQEVTALIERLTNRKQYAENKAFFDKFENTTQEKIDELLAKYALEMHPSDIFVPEFPDDAIKIMKDYTKKVKAISGESPVYYVIAEPADFRKAYEKRDPILLAQSPFGFYYQILGAWDKEMLILSEL